MHPSLYLLSCCARSARVEALRARRWAVGMHQPCNPPSSYTTASPEEYFHALANFIEKYKFIYQHKSIEFFTKSVWDTVPNEWKAPLLSLSNTEAAVFPQGKIIKPDWPQSLSDLLTEAQKLAMPRQEVVFSPSPHKSANPSSTNFSLPSLSRNMGTKKIHEVLKLSSLLADVAKKLGVESGHVEVVDVGSGEGYLGQVLHHEHGMSVVGVDERSEFTEGAQRRAYYITKEAEARARRANAQTEEMVREEHEKQRQALDDDEYKVKNVVACITLDLDPSEFEKIVWPSTLPERAILVGLHTCGVLANSMLRLFALSSRIHALVDVGCCYYRKQPDSKYEMMSAEGRHIAESLNLEMTPGALKLACEAACRMAAGTMDDYEYSMNSHFYRTILETALCEKFPNGHKFKVRGLPRKKSQNYEDYYNTAVRRMISQNGNSNTLNNGTESNDINNQSLTNTPNNMDEFLEKIKRMHVELERFNPHVNGTLLLRSVLAPVLESFILLDRWLYLKECGMDAFLIPLFDEGLSPRNVAIVAYKPKR